jgi:hypothetical protein
VSDIEYLPAARGRALAEQPEGAHTGLIFGRADGDRPANVIGNDLVSEVES